MADGETKPGYKVVALVATVSAVAVARRSLALVWRGATGAKPPDKPEHPAVPWAEAVSWAAISGAAMGAARMVAQKKVRTRWQRPDNELR